MVKKIYKYGTGQEVPKGAIFLSTAVEEVPGMRDVTRLVWHYFLVEVENDENEKKKHYCEVCGEVCTVTYNNNGKIKSICCPAHSGPHTSGDYSYLCGSDYCRCCQ